MIATKRLKTMLITILALSPSLLNAQGDERPPIPLSQRGAVFQRVGYTDIEVVYNRPVARGRSLFGGIVDWERIWTPGADSATVISFSNGVVVEGAHLDAGRYSIWVIPKRTEPWTVIFSSAVDVFHAPYPGPEHDVVRLTVAPQQGDHMEVLAFYFPVVSRDTALLRLHWGGTIVPLRIETTHQE